MSIGAKSKESMGKEPFKNVCRHQLKERGRKDLWDETESFVVLLKIESNDIFSLLG
jgi:hypothetical protein